MPRLIMIEGPRSGDCFDLRGESYLGYDSTGLSFSSFQTPNLLCTIRGGADRYELHNAGPTDRVLVNGEGVRSARLHHGDLISIADSLMIFDSDDGTGSDSGMAGVMGMGMGMPPNGQQPPGGMGMGGHPGAPQPGTRRLNDPFGGPADPFGMPQGGDPFGMPAHANDPFGMPQGDPHKSDSIRLGAIQAGEASDMMLGTVSIKREDLQRENINYRQKAYENEDQVLHQINDARRVKALFKASAKISAILDLQTLLNELLAILFEELPADRGSILLFDQSNRRLRTMASRNRRGENIKVRISKTIVKEVLRSKESLLTADAQRDRRLDMATSIVDEGIRSALCVPLVRGERILGIIFLDTFEQMRAFNEDDCDMLTAISMQAAMALENARLIKEMGDRERIKHELNLSATIQKQLLPKKLPRSQLIEVYGKMIPCKEMSGDYFDFMDHSGEGNFHICIGDVSGKGLPAGLVMIMARSYLRPLTKAGLPPREILAEANRLLYNDTRRDVFMSALVMHWSDETGKFTWSGAGHEHLIIYRARTRRTETIKAGGCVLAAVREAGHIYKDAELTLEPGDSVVLYTDGVTEARNPQGDFFAQDTLQPVQRLVELYGHLSAKDLLEAVLWELKQFINGADQADDITVVTIKRPGSPS